MCENFNFLFLELRNTGHRSAYNKINKNFN